MKPEDSEDAIKALIHTTLEASKKLAEGNPDAPVKADHFHNYEFLMSLFSRRQILYNQTLERLTRRIEWLTWVIALLTAVTAFKLFF